MLSRLHRINLFEKILKSTSTLRNLSLYTVPRTEFIEINEPAKYVYNIRLNRPKRRNAFILALWKELKSVVDYLAESPSCRSIVLSGNGKSFCAGIDLQDGVTELIGIVQDDKKDVARKSILLRRLLKICQDSFTSLETCPKPIIAAIHGHCIGAGINLIAEADVRYASSDAIFSIREVDIGLAADVGILNRINKLVGNDSLTRELAFTARDFGCSEAMKYGLISRQFQTADECYEGAVELATEIAARSPIAVQGTKLTLNYSRDHPIDDSINFIRTWNQSQLQSEDVMKAAMAAMTKQKIDFDDV